VESELKAIDGDLAPAKTIEYGRVDQAAEWALLARLYLNAEVYTGTAKYTEALTYAKKVIDAGYGLTSGYGKLFMADNDKQANEIIWAINCDGLHTQAYGILPFLCMRHAGMITTNMAWVADGMATGNICIWKFICRPEREY